jgi:YVTN family beta-propeller protein
VGIDQRVAGFLGRVLRGVDDPVGTCFQVAPGLVVTAYHVLDGLGVTGKGSVVEVDPLQGGAVRDASVLCLDPDHDLAVLALVESFPDSVAGLAPSDELKLGAAVAVTGFGEVEEDPGSAYRYLDAEGVWAGGTTRDDRLALGRLRTPDVLRGMSGAPVLRGGRVVGVVSGRYNSSGWLRDSVWVARAEDLRPLLAEHAEIDMLTSRSRPWTANSVIAGFVTLVIIGLVLAVTTYRGTGSSNRPSTDITASDARGRTPAVSTTISVGDAPADVELSPDGHRAYVTNAHGNTVSVIDVARNVVTTTIGVGDFPLNIAFSADGEWAYVTNGGSNTVSRIETGTNTVTATIQVGINPVGVAVTRDDRFVYVTDSDSDTVSVIDTRSNSVTATIPVVGGPLSIALSPDARRAYVTNQRSSTLAVIDTSRKIVTATIDVGKNPGNVALSRDGHLAYVANRNSDSVSVIDTDSYANTSILVGKHAWVVAISPDGSSAYVTNGDSGTVSVIDTRSRTVIATFSVGNNPINVTVAPDGRRAYVNNNGDNTVSVIELY